MDNILINQAYAELRYRKRLQASVEENNLGWVLFLAQEIVPNTNNGSHLIDSIIDYLHFRVDLARESVRKLDANYASQFDDPVDIMA